MKVLQFPYKGVYEYAHKRTVNIFFLLELSLNYDCIFISINLRYEFCKFFKIYNHNLVNIISKDILAVFIEFHDFCEADIYS
jgi:hypothetical protein